MIPRSADEDTRDELRQQITELRNEVDAVTRERDALYTEARDIQQEHDRLEVVNTAFCTAARQRVALPGRIEDLELMVGRLGEQRDELDEQVADLRHTLENQGVSMSWVHTARYTSDGSIPTATPWRQLEHDHRLAKQKVKDAVKYNDPNRDELQGQLDWIQRQRTRQCRLVDHVVAQMAGGKPFRAEMMEHVLTKGPCREEYLDQMDYLKSVKKVDLFREVKEALARYSSKRGNPAGQTETDRQVADAIYTVLARVGIKPKELRDAGVEGYGVNTERALKKLRDGVPRFTSGRKQEWTIATLDALEVGLRRQSVPCPDRTVDHPSTKGKNGRPEIVNVRELVRPLAAALRDCDICYEPDEKRPGMGKGSVTGDGSWREKLDRKGDSAPGVKRISTRQARKLVEEHLPWFQKPRTKWFCCGYCEERRRDARMLNNSKLDCYLIIDEATRRCPTLENEFSCDETQYNRYMQRCLLE